MSPEPTIDAIPRDKEKDNFLLLACDGVWDVMSSESGSKFVNSRLKKAEKRTPEGVELTCRQLVDRTLNLGSRDNVSVLIICFERAVKEKTRKKKAADGKAGAAAAVVDSNSRGGGGAGVDAAGVAASPPSGAGSDGGEAANGAKTAENTAAAGEAEIPFDEAGAGEIPFEEAGAGAGAGASDVHQNPDNGDDDEEEKEEEEGIFSIVSEAVVFSAMERAGDNAVHPSPSQPPLHLQTRMCSRRHSTGFMLTCDR